MSTEGEIRNAAYSRWEARGRPENDSWQDWFAAERRVDRRFYHSFPRMAGRTPDEIEKGLAILSSLVKYGLLLTPETHEIKQTLQNPPRVWTAWLVQQRFCLTELHPSEVPLHALDFGRFALEFDIVSARSIGAMPVWYFNRSSQEEGGTWYLAWMLTHLSFIREKLLLRLIDLVSDVDKAGSNANATVPLTNGVTITAPQAASLLDFLGLSGDFHPRQLEATIRLTSCLWSPAENLKYNSLIGYFKQREWRIVPGPERTGLQFEDLSNEQKSAIRDLNPKFFDREFQIQPTRTARRIDACKRLSQIDGKHILSTVRRIIAPNEAIPEVRQIVKPLSLNIEFAAIEDLW